MGEQKRRMDQGFKVRPVRPGEQIQVDVTNTPPRVCECGCKYFTPVVMVFTVSAFAPGNTTGQELTAQQPVLVCLECKKPL